MEFEIRLQTALDLVQRLYRIQITELRTRKQNDEFCARHRLHRIQYFLDEKSLELARTSLDDTTVLLISDVFLLHFALFTLHGVPYALGPFCPDYLTVTGAETVIRQYRLKGLEPAQIVNYCGMYPVLTEAQVIYIISAILQAVDPAEPVKSVRNISSHPEAMEEDEEDPLRLNHNTLIERRYAAERQMMEYIKQGDTRAALHQMHLVEQDARPMKRMGESRLAEKMGATILRTTVRMAAIEAGLPALVIDRITNQNAADINNAKDEQTVMVARERLIHDMCKAIRSANTNRYSALVQNTLYYLEHEYKSDLNLENLSAEFCVSANHLITVFKKEVGVTPNVYLTRVRMKKAAEMLISGQGAIGDISFAVGINDPNYFVKLFKKEYGETPTSFRKRHTI